MDIDHNGDTLTHVPELSFPDGNLIIQAGNSIFRVYGGFLAARSPIFQDMLSFSQPANAETMEGCPVVKLQDNEEDVAIFLRAIFDSSFFENYPVKTDLCTVVSVLRLSNKYAVDYLRRRALVHLESFFSTTLVEFRDDNSSFTQEQDVDDHGHIILAIEIIGELEALWMLPCAFYLLAATNPTRIQDILDCRGYKRHATKLSASDQILFLRSSILISHETHHILSLFRSLETIPGCTSADRTLCQASRRKAMASMQQKAYTKNDDANPLGIFEFDERTLKNRCCTVCYHATVKRLDEADEALWDKLPELCSLPPWEKLFEMKEAALSS